MKHSHAIVAAAGLAAGMGLMTLAYGATGRSASRADRQPITPLNRSIQDLTYKLSTIQPQSRSGFGEECVPQEHALIQDILDLWAITGNALVTLTEWDGCDPILYPNGVEFHCCDTVCIIESLQFEGYILDQEYSNRCPDFGECVCD